MSWWSLGLFIAAISASALEDGATGRNGLAEILFVVLVPLAVVAVFIVKLAQGKRHRGRHHQSHSHQSYDYRKHPEDFLLWFHW